MNEDENVKATLLHLLNACRPKTAICPSEVAREVFDQSTWRTRMPLVREVAAELVDQGVVEICQKGMAVTPGTVTGPIRIRLK